MVDIHLWHGSFGEGSQIVTCSHGVKILGTFTKNQNDHTTQIIKKTSVHNGKFLVDVFADNGAEYR